MSSLPVVAIAGATGHLGSYITSALLSPSFRPHFQKIKVLARKESDTTAHLGSQGAVIEIYDEADLARSLADTDILINTISSPGAAFRDKLLEAIAKSPTVKLYFPSEFGVNHTKHDFSQPEWDKKARHMKLAHQLLQLSTPNQHVRVCRVFNGLFLEDSIGPWFGFDTKRGVYTIAGSRDARISFTSLADVGRVVAALASMPPAAVPAEVQVAGDTLSVATIAELMGAAAAAVIQIKEIDLPAFKATTLAAAAAAAKESVSPEKHLRFLMGEGMIDYSAANQNELVNPRESNWKWATMAQYANETAGKPWAGVDWDE